MATNSKRLTEVQVTVLRAGAEGKDVIAALYDRAGKLRQPVRGLHSTLDSLMRRGLITYDRAKIEHASGGWIITDAGRRALFEATEPDNGSKT